MTKIVTALALLLCLVAFTPQASAAPPSNNPLVAIPISATGPGSVSSTTATFNGVFRIINFTYSNGTVNANGIITGTLNDGGKVSSVLTNASIPLPNPQSAAATAA